MKYLFAAAILLLASTAAPGATLLFDSYSGSGQYSTRGEETSPGSYIEAGVATTITNIAVPNDLEGAGNLKFRIFDHASNALLFSIAAPVADDAAGFSWKISPAFSFLLSAGTQYDIGAISDVGGLWSYDQIAESANGFTSIVENPNFSNYAAPEQVGHAAADAAVRLYSDGLGEVPEPATCGLAAAGLLALAFARRRSA